MKKIVLILLTFIYLQTWAIGNFELDSIQKSILANIACQYPLEGGDAVYSARVMLGIEWNCPNYNKTGGNTYNEPITEETPDKNKETENAFIGSIYPNPNNGRMQLEYLLEDNNEGRMELFGISGRLIASYPLQTGRHTLSVHKNDLSNGIYYARIVINGRTVLNEKVVVIK